MIKTVEGKNGVCDDCHEKTEVRKYIGQEDFKFIFSKNVCGRCGNQIEDYNAIVNGGETVLSIFKKEVEESHEFYLKELKEIGKKLADLRSIYDAMQDGKLNDISKDINRIKKNLNKIKKMEKQTSKNYYIKRNTGEIRNME